MEDKALWFAVGVGVGFGIAGFILACLNAQSMEREVRGVSREEIEGVEI